MVKLIGSNKIKTAVFISGTGSNLKNLIKFSLLKKSPIKISFIVSNNIKAKGLYFAKKYRIKKKTYNFKNKKLLNGCANITGGGLSDNIKRIIPNKLCAEIDLTKINTFKIFKWLKRNNIDDKEMLKTFNCGVGFCLIVNPKNLNKINRYFSKNYKPYVIGKISKRLNKVKLNGRINWF